MFTLKKKDFRWLANRLGWRVYFFDGHSVSALSDRARAELPDALSPEKASEALGGAFSPEALKLAYHERRPRHIPYLREEGLLLPASGGTLLIVPEHQSQSMNSAMAKHDTAHALSLVMAWSRVAEREELGSRRAAMEGIRSAVGAAKMALDAPLGGHQERPSHVRLHALAEEVIALLAPLRNEAGVRISMEIEPTLTAYMPRTILYRALWNLLENAFKALRRGDRVTLRAWESDGRIALEVRDNGPGIPPQKRSRLFTRGPALVGEESRGGFGLSGIAEGLRAVGASIELEPAPPGAGACFILDLPAAPRLPNRARSGVRAVNSTGRVLLLEDDPSLREVLAATFELEGLHVDGYDSSLPEDVHAYDAALIDLNLSHRSGLELTAELYKRGFRGVLHLMSGGEAPESVRSLPEMSFLRKPFDPLEAARIIRKSIDKKRRSAVDSRAL